MESAAALRRQSRFTEAGERLDDALRRHPHDRGLLFERVELHQARRELDAALSAVDAVLAEDAAQGARDDAHQRHLVRKALLQLERGDRDGARETVDLAEARFPGSIEVRSARGWLQFHQHAYGDALETFESILRSPSGERCESALQGRIAAHRSRGQLALARRAAEEASTLLPDSPGIHAEHGWIEMASGNYVSAREHFDAVCRLIPRDPLAIVNAAWSWRAGLARNLDRAESLCNEALRLEPRCAQAYACRGVIAAERQDVIGAEADLRHSLRLKPLSGTHADLAALLIQEERFDDAARELEQALALNPDDPAARLQQGSLYLRTGRASEALREYRRALALNPGDPEAHAALAVALMESGRGGDAESFLRASLGSLSHSGRWKLHLLLCQLLTQQGDDTCDPRFYRDALEQAGRAMNLESLHAAPHFHAGIVRYKLEDYPGALKSFNRCLAQDPQHAGALLHAQRLRLLIRRELERSRIGKGESWGLAAIFLACLVAVWVLHVARPDAVGSSVLMGMSTLLLGLVVASLVLPWLTHLKFTGFEVELTSPPARDSLASGPRGDIGFAGPGQALT
ncbi:MAG TPA: tetratricopeptide repeat protein [Longimicrobium sp.]